MIPKLGHRFLHMLNVFPIFCNIYVYNVECWIASTSHLLEKHLQGHIIFLLHQIIVFSEFLKLTWVPI